MRKLLYIVCLILDCFSAQGQGHGNGYGYTGTASGAVTISQVLNLSVTNLSGNVSFTTISNYANGITVSNYATIAIKSNVPWLLELSSASTFTATGGGASANMPASILGIRQHSYWGGGSSSFTPVTSGFSTTGNAGNASASGNTFNIDLNFNPGYGYSGGNYSIALLYTLTHQ